MKMVNSRAKRTVAERPLAVNREIGNNRQMQTASATVSKHRYLAEIVFVAVFASFSTYISVVLSAPPSPWNALWMMVFPCFLGLSLNKNAARIVMAVVLLIVSLIACSIVGNAMGGI